MMSLLPLLASPTLAATFVVGASPCSDDGPGSEAEPWCTIGRATSVAGAGDTVRIHAGTYLEELNPRSGEEGAPVVFEAYGDGEVLLTGTSSEYAIINLEGVAWIVIDGLTVRNVIGWVHAVDASHVTIQNSVFEVATATGTRGGIKFEGGSHNRVVDNVLTDGNDLVMFYDSDHNLLAGNTITKARHSIFAIKCGDYNVVRDNYLANEDQKIGEVFDCEDEGIYDSTTRNLIEGNEFAETAPAVGESPFAGIQYAGQEGIVRRNVFHDNVGPPFDFTIYPDEALFNRDNRVYHNVFVDNHFGGISVSGATGHTFSGQVVANNILFRNDFLDYDGRWAWYEALDGQPVQVITGRTTDVRFDHDLVFSSKVDELYTVALGDRDEASNPAPQPLSWWESNEPQMFQDVLQADPVFVDVDGRDFALQATSPAIDAGTWLTTIREAGSGTVLPVEDALPFFDGFAIEGEEGDLVQLEGDATRARVVGVDVERRTLTLETALTWTAGQGLALAYAGKGPDVGAFELGLDDTSPGDGGGSDGGDDTAGDADGGGDEGASDDPDRPASEEDSGCGCGSARGGSGTLGGPSVLVLALLARRRQGRPMAKYSKPAASSSSRG